MPGPQQAGADGKSGHSFQPASGAGSPRRIPLPTRVSMNWFCAQRSP